MKRIRSQSEKNTSQMLKRVLVAHLQDFQMKFVSTNYVYQLLTTQFASLKKFIISQLYVICVDSFKNIFNQMNLKSIKVCSLFHFSRQESVAILQQCLRNFTLTIHKFNILLLQLQMLILLCNIDQFKGLQNSDRTYKSVEQQTNVAISVQTSNKQINKYQFANNRMTNRNKIKSLQVNLITAATQKVLLKNLKNKNVCAKN
eukprot:TRINITY_DN15626_c0_g1_i1.p3 TRINITY_DN15626_c0_g1~~TRINITY_DN15626_c0_g1_i1.p3  ORF type:complete len:202 (+),score=-15.74 TRINITY_DN15626_c0_g1_i1:388-993(+)